MAVIYCPGCGRARLRNEEHDRFICEECRERWTIVAWQLDEPLDLVDTPALFRPDTDPVLEENLRAAYDRVTRKIRGMRKGGVK